MTEIPMPGDYGGQAPPQPKQKGFCSKCCENTCMVIGICAVCICLFAVVMLLSVGFFFFDFF